MSAVRASSTQTRIVAGVLAHLYSQCVTVVIQLASLPIFLARWDLATYGRWLMIQAVPAYLTISDVGLLTTAGNLMTMHQARRESVEVNRVFNSSVTAILILGPAMAVLSGVLLLNFSFGLSVDERVALYVMILTAMLTVACGIYEASYRPFGKYPRVTFFLSTARVLEWLGSIVGLFVGLTLTSAALGLFSGRVVTAVVMIFLMKHDIPELRLNLRMSSWRLIRRLLSSGVGFLSFPLGNVLTLQGTVLLVGAQLGGAAVTLFSSIRTLTRLLTQISTTTSKAMGPEVAALYGAGDHRGIRALSQRIQWRIVPATMAGALILLPLGPLILKIWSRGKLSMDMPAYSLLLVAAVASAFWQIKSVLLTATNRHILLALIFAAVSVLSLVAGYLLNPHFGITGAAAATCLVDLSMIVGTNLALRRT